MSRIESLQGTGQRAHLNDGTASKLAIKLKQSLVLIDQFGMSMSCLHNTKVIDTANFIFKSRRSRAVLNQK